MTKTMEDNFFETYMKYVFYSKFIKDRKMKYRSQRTLMSYLIKDTATKPNFHFHQQDVLYTLRTILLLYCFKMKDIYIVL